MNLFFYVDPPGWGAINLVLWGVCKQLVLEGARELHFLLSVHTNTNLEKILFYTFYRGIWNGCYRRTSCLGERV